MKLSDVRKIPLRAHHSPTAMRIDRPTDGRDHNIEVVVFAICWTPIMNGFRVGAEQSEYQKNR